MLNACNRICAGISVCASVYAAIVRVVRERGDWRASCSGNRTSWRRIKDFSTVFAQLLNKCNHWEWFKGIGTLSLNRSHRVDGVGSFDSSLEVLGYLKGFEGYGVRAIKLLPHGEKFYSIQLYRQSESVSVTVSWNLKSERCAPVPQWSIQTRNWNRGSITHSSAAQVQIIRSICFGIREARSQLQRW